ncbi:hypothetical protein GCM10025777_06730 [Membranihabitans marinus]
MCFTYSQAWAQQQSQQKILVRQISFEGNIKTKPQRILREMEINVGDSLTLTSIQKKLKLSKNRIINTGLFTDVVTNLYFDEENYKNVSIIISVKEGLFVIPIPIIELAARNFNVWINEYDSHIKFLNLGLYLKLKNLTGNADQLNLLAQGGFDRKFSVNYISPYFDRERKWNFQFTSLLNSNKEVSYIGDDGIPTFASNNNKYLHHRFESGFSLNYRPNYINTFSVKLGFNYQGISSELLETIPTFLAGKKYQRYSDIELSYSIEQRNNKYLATQGWFSKIKVQKNGLFGEDDYQAWNVKGDLHVHDYLGKGWTWNKSLIVRALLPRDKYPYYNLNRLGGEAEYVRGYENYQIEGSSLVIGKTSMMKKIIDRPINLGKLMPFVNYKSMDTKIYLSLNFDYGYVWDNYYYTSEWVNKPLYGGGLGINFLLYHQLGIIFEASMDRENNFGIFFHINDTL